MSKLTFDTVKKGDMIFVPLPGVSYRATQEVVVDKQGVAIVLLKTHGGDKPHIMSQADFDAAGYMGVTTEMISADFDVNNARGPVLHSVIDIAKHA